MKRLYFILISTLGLFFTSCEEDFLFDDIEFTPSVVVNSVFTVGRSWEVNLSYSRSRLKSNSKILPILDAEVEVLERATNRLITLKHSKDGNYSSEFYLPLPDKIYELIVRVPGYATVKATSMAPKKARVEIISNVVEKLEFDIQGVNSNYYIWDLVFTNNNNQLDTSKTVNPKDLISGIKNYNDLNSYLQDLSNPKTNDSNNNGVKSAAYAFEEERFNEQGPDGSQPDPIKKKYLRLITSSKEFYEFYKSVESFGIADHNCSFCQGTDIKSNIVGGLGIFAGYTEEFKEIK